MPYADPADRAARYRVYRALAADEIKGRQQLWYEQNAERVKAAARERYRRRKAAKRVAVAIVELSTSSS